MEGVYDLLINLRKMTGIYYYDARIYSDNISEYTASSKYSDIRIGNRTVKERIQELVQHKDLIVIEELSSLSHDAAADEILVFSSSVYSKDLPSLLKFLKFAGFSMINTFWGHKNCFIYKGNKDRLVSYIDEQINKDIYFLRFPEFILDLSSLPELKSVLSDSHDSRHFNEIKSVDELYVKKSVDSVKLTTEFEFLRNVPGQLKNYFVEVFEFKQEADYAQYSMVAYDYKDVAQLYITRSLTEDSFGVLISLIQKYFHDAAKPTGLPYERNSFDDIIRKNKARLEQLKKIAYYDSLNSFILNHKGISLTDHHARIENELKRRKNTFESEDYIFSHGDLCYSNILFSPENVEIKLIDPKGFENSGMRSPYYDMAKLSHSVFGNYDLIINHLADVDFDQEMHAYLNFSKFNYIKQFDYHFLNMVARMKLDLTLIRLIESSLFLSMIPFHYENKRKAFMLCMRSVEVFEECTSS